MARRKAPAVDAPQSEAEAAALLAEYVATERLILNGRLQCERMIDAIKAGRDTSALLLQGEQALRFAQLKAWWEAGGKALAKDKRSAELAGARIGIRLTPHKVKLARGMKAEGVIAWLKGLAWDRASEFLRTKEELDKQAIIKAAIADETVRTTLAGGGVTTVQDDEFFIDAGLDETALRSEQEG